jgi:hypothetical protein
MTAATVWVPEPRAIFAYNLLVDQHGEKITYKQLYIDMQPQFGWPIWRPGNAWPKLLPLAEVGIMNGLRNEPCLAALVRWQDRLYIGKGYQTAHFNCHGARLTRHPYDCPCFDQRMECWDRIQRGAWNETRLIRAYPYRHWA